MARERRILGEGWMLRNALDDLGSVFAVHRVALELVQCKSPIILFYL